MKFPYASVYWAFWAIYGTEDGLFPPAGYAFIVDKDGKYVIDKDGKYLISKI